MDINKYLSKKRQMVDRALLEYLPGPKGPSAELIRAMSYSVSVGGKRLRPILMLAVANMLGKPPGRILKAACAVEYVHTSTLILDDLPCMDDSGLRRGRPSVHKKFGESTAILASYALVISAFRLLASNAQATFKDADMIEKVIEFMSRAVGSSGVCAGQYVDLATGADKININTLRYLHQHKTADLFMACCQIAACLSGATDTKLAALGRYGRYMGLAFQAHDDVLSVTRTERQLGKQTKKDKDSPNIVNLFGLDKARGLLDAYVKKAKSQLSPFGTKAKTLGGILEYVIRREK